MHQQMYQLGEIALRGIAMPCHVEDNVGIVLSDVAGNTYYIQEKANIHIGFFWLWMISATALALTVLVVCAVLYNIGKKHAEGTKN